MKWRILAAVSFAAACVHSTEPAPEPSVLAQAHALDEQAAALFQNGEYPQAAVRARQALALKEGALGATSLEAAATLHQLARILWSKGDVDEARSVEQRALEIRLRALGPDHPDVAACLNVLGVIAAEAGDYATAVRSHERALQIRQAALGAEHKDVAQSLNNLAVAYERRGENETALDLYERALAIRIRVLGPDDPLVAWSLNNVAAIRRARGDLAGALPLYERALGIWERSLGADHPDVTVGLSAVATAKRDQGDYAGALGLFERSQRIRESAGGPEDLGVALNLADLAEVHLAIGDGAGRPLAERALAIEERALGADHPDIARIRDILAREARVRGDGKTAAELSRQALAIVERSVARNIDAFTERQQIAFLARNRGFLDALLSTPGVPDDEAYAHLLSWKGAAALIASARQLEAWARAERSDGTGEKLAELRLVRAQLAQLSLATPEDAGGRQRLAQRVAALTERERALDSDLAAASAGFRARAAFLSAGAADICAQLPAGTALVDFVAWRQADAKPPPPNPHPDRLTAFVLTPGPCHVRRVDLPQSYEKISKLTEFWRAAAAYGAPALALRRGRALRVAAFDPLVPALGSARTLLIAPDGPVAAVALGALPLGEDGTHALLERYTLSYLDSGKDVVRDTPSAPSGPRAPLVVGGAEFAKAALPSSMDAACALDLPPLPGARAEAKLVAGRLGEGSELLTGAAATERAFRDAAAGRSILHVATHAFLLPARCAAANAHPMLLSGLALTPGPKGDPDDDGMLSAADLATFDLRGTRLVVLSACDTGRGEIIDGQGVLGLRRAVLTGGARALVMSLWRVPDAETSALMGRFYGHLRESPPAEALRAAQIEMLADLRAAGSEDAVLRVGSFIAAALPAPAGSARP